MVSQMSRAILMADRIPDDVNQEVSDILDAGEKSKVGPLMLMLDFRTIYGDEIGTLLPVPDTKEGETGNLPYDKYTDHVNGEKVDGSFWADFAARTKEGRRIETALDFIKKAKETSKEIPAEYAVLNGEQGKRLSLQRRWEQRRTSLRTLYRKAARLHFQFAAVNAMEGVEAVYVTDTEADGSKTIANTTLPIMVQHPTDRAKFKPMSVGSFLSLDVKKALANGGGYQKLIDTASRGTKDKKKVQNGDGKLELKDMANVGLQMANTLDDRQNYAKLQQMVAKDDDLLIAMTELRDAISGIVDVHEKKYNRIAAERAEAA